MVFNELRHRWDEDCDGLIIVRQQDIPDDFLDDLRNARDETAAQRCPDLHRVASVPEFVIDLWIRQGRDPYNAAPSDVVRWLEQADLQAFITTEKAV